MKKQSRFIGTLLVAIALTMTFTACSRKSGAQSTGAAADSPKYVIGVIPFADTALEQIYWNSYLNDYAAKQFNITFNFVPAPGQDADAAVKVVEELKLAGCQGILGIIDAPAAIEKANALGMWYMRSGGLAALGDYEAVKNLPYYLGSSGPALEDEYKAGYDITKHFIGSGAKNLLVCGFLLGLHIPSDMHIQRFEGIRDALLEAGATYTPPASGSVVNGPGVGAFASGDSGLTITTIYGLAGAEYLDATFAERFTTACSGKQFDAIIMGNGDMNNLLKGMGIAGAKIGEVDSFNSVIKANFEAGVESMIVGKYGSSVAPALAALINAIDGNPELAKNPDGTGSRLQAPYWTATSLDEFNAKYAFDDLSNPAFNKDIISRYIKRLNPALTREQFVAFAAFDYEALKALH